MDHICDGLINGQDGNRQHRKEEASPCPDGINKCQVEPATALSNGKTNKTDTQESISKGKPNVDETLLKDNASSSIISHGNADDDDDEQPKHQTVELPATNVFSTSEKLTFENTIFESKLAVEDLALTSRIDDDFRHLDRTSSSTNHMSEKIEHHQQTQRRPDKPQNLKTPPTLRQPNEELKTQDFDEKNRIFRKQHGKWTKNDKCETTNQDCLRDDHHHIADCSDEQMEEKQTKYFVPKLKKTNIFPTETTVFRHHSQVNNCQNNSSKSSSVLVYLSL
jgi:hypothetical protein